MPSAEEQLVEAMAEVIDADLNARGWHGVGNQLARALLPFIQEARLAEREACAKVAEGHYAGHGDELKTMRAFNYERAGKCIAVAIRSQRP